MREGTESSGNVFLYSELYNNYFPVCDDDWDDNDALVICRMLGYSSGISTIESQFGASGRPPVLMKPPGDWSPVEPGDRKSHTKPRFPQIPGGGKGLKSYNPRVKHSDMTFGTLVLVHYVRIGPPQL